MVKDEKGKEKEKFPRRVNRINYSVGSLGSELTTTLRSDSWTNPETGEFEKPEIIFSAQTPRFKNRSGYAVDIDLSLDVDDLLSFRDHIDEVIKFVETVDFKQQERHKRNVAGIDELIKMFKD